MDWFNQYILNLSSSHNLGFSCPPRTRVKKLRMGNIFYIFGSDISKVEISKALHGTGMEFGGGGHHFEVNHLMNCVCLSRFWTLWNS